VDLLITDANGHSYTFTTNFDEVLSGVTNSGWWSNTLTNTSDNPNFLVDNDPGNNTNDYFTFNMGQNTLGAAIVSAVLSIPTDYGFCSPDPSCETSGLPVTYFVGRVVD
jgi:hypothetical protein